MASWALAKAILASAQTLAPTFSFPLSLVHRYNGWEVISSKEAVGKVTQTSLGVGLNEPFSVVSFWMTRTLLCPILESSLFFFALIWAYISWLNLVIISARRKDKYLSHKKGEEKRLVNKLALDQLTFFFSPYSTKNVVGRLRTQPMTSQSSRVNQLVKIFDGTCVFNNRLNMPSEFTIELGTLLNYKTSGKILRDKKGRLE